MKYEQDPPHREIQSLQELIVKNPVVFPYVQAEREDGSGPLRHQGETYNLGLQGLRRNLDMHRRTVVDPLLKEEVLEVVPQVHQLVGWLLRSL